MPVYQASPINRKVLQAVPGLPAYLWGSFDRLVAPTRMLITSLSLVSPTAQVTGVVTEGQIPTVGQLVSIAGALPAYFNVTNAKITAVSSAATPDVGVYTISFALTNSNIPTTNSPGLAVAPQVEIGEQVTAASSRAVAIQVNINAAAVQAIRFDVSAANATGSFDVVAQSAVYDIDTEYQDMGTILSVVAGTPTSATTTFASEHDLFVRLTNRNLAGVGASLVIGKVTV